MFAFPISSHFTEDSDLAYTDTCNSILGLKAEVKKTNEERLLL